jgi:hypothetical protein
MNKISESEFEKICCGIYKDRMIICKHNPIGTQDETLLWMLMSVLYSYLSLAENEMPCFPGKPNADTYRDAILHMLKGRKESDFDEKTHLEKLMNDN